jgi:oligopeptide transport system substrate-binding protein
MRNWKKFALSGLAVVAAALVLSGCSSQSSKNISFMLPTDVSTLDPTTVQDQYSYDVIGNV